MGKKSGITRGGYHPAIAAMKASMELRYQLMDEALSRSITKNETIDMTAVTHAMDVYRDYFGQAALLSICGGKDWRQAAVDIQAAVNDLELDKLIS